MLLSWSRLPIGGRNRRIVAAIIGGSLLGMTAIAVPVKAEIVTYDFTVRLFETALLPGLPETYNGSFSYDTDRPLLPGQPAYEFIDFSFNFLEPVPRALPRPKVYSTTDLVGFAGSSRLGSRLAVESIPTVIPPTTSAAGGFAFSVQLTDAARIDAIFGQDLFAPGSGVQNLLQLASLPTSACEGDLCIDVDDPPAPENVGEFVAVTRRLSVPPTAKVPEPSLLLGVIASGAVYGKYRSKRRFV